MLSFETLLLFIMTNLYRNSAAEAFSGMVYTNTFCIILVFVYVRKSSQLIYHCEKLQNILTNLSLSIRHKNGLWSKKQKQKKTHNPSSSPYFPNEWAKLSKHKCYRFPKKLHQITRSLLALTTERGLRGHRQRSWIISK